MSRKATVRSSVALRARWAMVFLHDLGSDGMAFGLVGIEERVRRRPVDDLGELPAQVDRVLYAEVEALSAEGRMHVRGVAGDEDSPVGGR